MHKKKPVARYMESGGSDTSSKGIPSKVSKRLKENFGVAEFQQNWGKDNSRMDDGRYENKIRHIPVWK